MSAPLYHPSRKRGRERSARAVHDKNKPTFLLLNVTLLHLAGADRVPEKNQLDLTEWTGYLRIGSGDSEHCNWRKHHMKIWTKPAVREQEVGLEVTSYLPAEIDII
jgi:coenzyme PQQ precursor peptide PqqA